MGTNGNQFTSLKKLSVFFQNVKISITKRVQLSCSVAQSCSGETALFCCEVRLELFGLSYVESKHSSVHSQPLE